MFHTVGEVTEAIHHCKTIDEIETIYTNLYDLQRIHKSYAPHEMSVISHVYWIRLKLLGGQ